MSQLLRRWRKTLQNYGLRLLSPARRLDFLPEQTVQIYNLHRMLTARDGKPPSSGEISSYLNEAVSRQTVHYHLSKLRLVGLVEGDVQTPDQHDVTYLFGSAVCLLRQWVEAHPTSDLALESAQLLHALQLSKVVDKIELEELDIPEIPEWFK